MEMFKRLICFASLTGVLTLVGCGGAPQDNPEWLEQRGLGESFAVSLTGAEGPVVVSIGGRSMTFAGDSTQTLGGFLDTTGEGFTATIVSSPETQDCSFSPSNLSEIIASANMTVSCGVPGISGFVKNFFTGETVSGASIVVTEVTDTGSTAFANLSSAADGSYEALDTAPDNRYVVTVSAAGYSPQTVIGLPLANRSIVTENVSIVPVNATVAETPSTAMVFSIDGVDVLEIPANGLVNSDGGAPVGDVSASITLLDPSSGPTALPGRYEYFNGSTSAFIESYGGVSVVIVDSTGRALQLNDGVSAQVAVPIAAKALSSGPSSAEIYMFNATTGYWENQTVSARNNTGAVPVYEATVTSLSHVFAAGSVYTTVPVQGCIEDAGGNKVMGITIVAEGNTYLGTSYGISNDSGDFTVDARAGSELFVYGLFGARSRTQSVTTTTSGVTLADCLLFDLASTVITLTWGESPRDLDSHFYGPNPGSSARFHIDYTQKEVEVNSQTLFLDVDDVTSYGPEITTIPRYPAAGTYEFLVDDFSGGMVDNIQTSEARVAVNAQGEDFTFSAPAGTPTRCWHVFNIEVDSALQGVIVPVNTWENREVCTQTGSIALQNASGGVSVKPSRAPAHVVNKYYAPQQ